MPANPSGDKPNVDLNLDTLEREGAPEPFAFVLGGDRFVCEDPQELDYRDFSQIDESDLEGQFKMLLPKDHAKFFKHKLQLWKQMRLMRDIVNHYGLGEGVASPLS